MKNNGLTIGLLPGEFAVWKLPPDSQFPPIENQSFLSITRTAGELSIVSPSQSVPPGASVEGGWSCLRVAGPLTFELVGILASLTEPLAQAGVSVFAISTFDTDYLLVKTDDLDHACTALEDAGHRIIRS